MEAGKMFLENYYEYEVTDIKEGGMGMVLILNRLSKPNLFDFVYLNKLAAKTFKDNEYVNNNKLLFEMELNIWLNLDNIEHIAKLLKIIYFRNNLFALMPCYDFSLRDFMKNNKISIKQALFIILTIVIGLFDVLKKYGVVHQDIKPDNILGNYGDNKLYISDWGISNIQRNYCPEIPNRDWIPVSFIEVMSNAGTLPYMSPERFYGFPSNLTSDIYSLGMIFYELLFGCLPFDFNSLKPIEKQIIEFDYYNNALKALKDCHYANCSDLLLKCIHPDLNNRYNDYKKLGRDISKLYNKYNKL